jgi:hypothetical protein
MTIDTLMRSLVAELAAGGVPAPLAQDFTLAALWDDLARLAGEPIPPEVAALLSGWGALPTRAGRARAARAAAPFAPQRLRHDE